MGGSRSRAIGATLFFLGATFFSGTAADDADEFDTLDFFESISSLDPPSLSCNMQTLFSLRSAWYDEGDVCNRKLPFEFWIYMKAEGSAKDPDADHVRKECLMSKDVGVVELVTPEDWDKTIMDAAPGKLVRETKRAASYLVESPLDFEAMCVDDQVKKVSRIIATTAKVHQFSPQKFKKHLRNTKNTAEIVHGVGALISGLEKLGCQRTTGEEQTLCIMSDSFNRRGSQFALQESGEFPPDEFLTIVEDLPKEFGMGLDEGTAMTLLAYGIARGANFKFNTMLMGKVTAADDIRHLATHEDTGGEGCDIILDNISFGDEPEFRKGVVAKAVEEAVATGSLHFSSTGNFRNGYKFTSHWECASDIYGEITSEPCDNGVASHVFNPEANGVHRYLLPLDGTSFSPGGNTFFLHWDDDEGTSRSVVVELWSLFEVSGEEYTILARIEAVSDFGAAMVSLTLPEGAAVGELFYLTISQVHSDQENVEMRLTSWTDKIFSDCYDGSRFAHPCAASTGGAAATSNWGASGDAGAFADPEVGLVGTRLNTVNTAATDLIVPTDIPVLAPVAAAITAIVRSACFPRVVTQIDMIEILTDTYTFDATSDAHGTKDTWGAETRDGNISADQILGWIAANCQESCHGSVTF